MASDELDKAVTTANALGELVKSAGNSKEGKQAASNLGKAAVTLTDAVNNCLLPIAAVNYAFGKAKDYFAVQFKEDLASNTVQIPPESLIEPKASLAGPALQGLAFSHNEPDLKDLYLKLLATAMDGRYADSAHPAFVEILRQLSAEEAKLLRVVLREGQLPIGYIKEKILPHGNRTLWKHLLNWTDDDTGEVAINLHLPAMIDNWIRLGIVEVRYDRWLSEAIQYEWMDTRPELLKLRSVYQSETSTVTVEKGILEPTELGKQFAMAVGIVDGPSGIMNLLSEVSAQVSPGS